MKIAVKIDERSVNIRTVRVKWEGPLTVEEVLEMNLRHKDFGLYQIYGRHIIFGLNKWVLGVEPFIDSGPSDVKPFGGFCFAAAGLYEVEDAFA